MKQFWVKSKLLDKIPLKKVNYLQIKVNNLKSREEGAFTQYKLLLNDFILRCHVNFEEKKIKLLYNPLETNTENIIKLISDFNPIIEEEKTISFEEFMKKTFHLE